MPPSESYLYAVKAAQNYLAFQSADPREAQAALVRVIVGAMIEEFETQKRSLCSKCRTSHSQRFKEAPP